MAPDKSNEAIGRVSSRNAGGVPGPQGAAACSLLETHPKVFSLLLFRRDLPLRRDCLLLLLFWLHLRRMVVCAARNGNVGHAVIEQVLGPQFGIRVDQHSVGGLPLAGMTRQRVCVQTADFSAVANFPVYDAWDVRICPRPALIWFEFPSQLSVFGAIYGKFGRKTSEYWYSGIFGA